MLAKYFIRENQKTFRIFHGGAFDVQFTEKLFVNRSFKANIHFHLEQLNSRFLVYLLKRKKSLFLFGFGLLHGIIIECYSRIPRNKMPCLSVFALKPWGQSTHRFFREPILVCLHYLGLTRLDTHHSMSYSHTF